MFNVGDRVICTADYSGGATRGESGVILVSDGDDPVLVEFDNPVLDVTSKKVIGHSGYGNGRTGHCLWVLQRSLEFEYEPLSPKCGDLNLLGL